MTDEEHSAPKKRKPTSGTLDPEAGDRMPFELIGKGIPLDPEIIARLERARKKEERKTK
jgi:hypothetical protein